METTRSGGVFDDTWWGYDPQTGNRISKQYADNSLVQTAYTPDGLLATNHFPNGHWIANCYDGNRRQIGVDSDDESCRYSLTLDIFGRTIAATNYFVNYTYNLSSYGYVTNEMFSCGDEIISTSRCYDDCGRVVGVSSTDYEGLKTNYSDDGIISSMSNSEAQITFQ